MIFIYLRKKKKTNKHNDKKKTHKMAASLYLKLLIDF